MMSHHYFFEVKWRGVYSVCLCMCMYVCVKSLYRKEHCKTKIRTKGNGIDKKAVRVFF